jgi:hypothetical protein
MAWYVFALVDAPPERPPGRGLSSPLTLVPVGGAFALVERRDDVPPVALGTLKKHYAVVTRVARSVRAIVPMRFGTLLEPSELRELLDERDEEVAEALALVRDCVQFTWRAAAANKGKASEDRSRKESGAEYLRRVTRPAVPPVFRAVHQALGGLARRERAEPAKASRPATLHHLVAKQKVRAYERSSTALTSASNLVVTGPYPPFAFVPELL